MCGKSGPTPCVDKPYRPLWGVGGANHLPKFKPAWRQCYVHDQNLCSILSQALLTLAVLKKSQLYADELCVLKLTRPISSVWQEQTGFSSASGTNFVSLRLIGLSAGISEVIQESTHSFTRPALVTPHLLLEISDLSFVDHALVWASALVEVYRY